MNKLVVLSAVAGLAIAGCGSSSSTSSSGAGSGSGPGANGTHSASAVPASGAGTSVALNATDFRFSQPTIRAKAGTVTIRLANHGKYPHSIEIAAPGGDKKLSAALAPGQSGTLTVKLKPGTYQFFCPIPGHRQAGMVGKIVVGNAGAGGAVAAATKKASPAPTTAVYGY